MRGTAMACGGLLLLARLAGAATVTLQEGAGGYAGLADAFIQLDVTTPAGSDDYLRLYWSSG